MTGRDPVLLLREGARMQLRGALGASEAFAAVIARMLEVSLERRYPEPALYPRAAFEYGRALWVEEYADTELATRVGLGLFRPLVMAKLFGKEPDVERARKTLYEELPPVFDYLETSIATRQFLVGDTFGIADIAVASQFVNFNHAGATLDASRWPTLSTYIERMHARPSFAACIEAERKLLPASDVRL
jgi:glutathione S-transferase